HAQIFVQKSSHGLFYPCCSIKYLTFIWNLTFCITGSLILAIGIWGLSDKESLTSERITYLGSDPMLFFVLAGLAASTMALLGCTGALFENTCLLKLFTGGIITFVILEALGGIVLVSVQHQIKASLQDSLMVAVLRYQDDPDLQFIMDEIQAGLQCCGVESYLDWKTNFYRLNMKMLLGQTVFTKGFTKGIYKGNNSIKSLMEKRPTIPSMPQPAMVGCLGLFFSRHLHKIVLINTDEML
uniref:Tetraspanin 10 n=1 Tax=Varanus komodoensis TaxID=61221 RepID=A0A8D2Q7N5_VARKO